MEACLVLPPFWSSLSNGLGVALGAGWSVLMEIVLLTPAGIKLVFIALRGRAFSFSAADV